MEGTATGSSCGAPLPPSHNNRRPRGRVREVSSRFMSPSPNPNRRHQSPDPLATAHDGINTLFLPIPIPTPSQIPKSKQRYMKLFKDKENTYTAGVTTTPRPGTPTLSVSSRYRLTHHHHRINSNSAAAKLLQTSSDASSVCSESDDDDPGDSRVNCSLPDLRSSSVSVSTTSTRSVDMKHPPSSPFSRSLPLSSASSSASREKQAHSVSSKAVKIGEGEGEGPPVPPPPCAKASETTKGKKCVSSHQEDVIYLKMLYSRHLQWRYANAKAATAIKAQETQALKALYSHAMKTSELRHSVNRKRQELGLLQRSKTLSTILEAQIPYLDEWSSLQEDYSVSLTEATQALLNAAVQLSVGANVKVDVREVGEALNSALKLMETIDFHIQKFMPKAEETDIFISELARHVGGERVSIAEYGDLLSKLHKSQVEECSLRGQLIQLHSVCYKDKTREQ